MFGSKTKGKYRVAKVLGREYAIADNKYGMGYSPHPGLIGKYYDETWASLRKAKSPTNYVHHNERDHQNFMEVK